MHTWRSRVDSSKMLIGSYRPRSGSIDWSVMPYSSSRGVHPRPKLNIRKTLSMEDHHVFGVKQKSFHPYNPMSSFLELERIYISLS